MMPSQWRNIHPCGARGWHECPELPQLVEAKKLAIQRLRLRVLDTRHLVQNEKWDYDQPATVTGG